MSDFLTPDFVASPVFIHLLHGRDDPDEDMTNWGFAGSLLGPFEAVHFTYKEHIRCIEDAHKGTELELRFHDDLLVYDGNIMATSKSAAVSVSIIKIWFRSFLPRSISLRVSLKASSGAAKVSAPNGRLGP